MIADPAAGSNFTVVWWDPALLDRPGDDGRGVRRDDLIAKDARPMDVAADRARVEAWAAARAGVLAQAARPSLDVVTATEWVGRDATPGAAVTIEDCSIPGPRPSGRRFGVLVHALLAAVPIDATDDQVRELAVLEARVLGASEPERDAAASTVVRTLAHRLLDEARLAVAAGRLCHREAPVSLVRDGALIDGQVDLAFDSADGWQVVDFKTDAELGASEDLYRRQVALYAEAIAAITGRPATATILRV